ncbi:hypothetical protein H6P81_017751 [Aristolochia fimbriata]|uniref:AMP-activated protein kinase glycogen-binding domain-containing protein n=1 Tax=Aristolochia fimbriata TaxID=158543 RepID=A0AAV7E3C3_ARIFI|nr:hypothetical protein H6P81_017751 [Aristolochia fimbriata]
MATPHSLNFCVVPPKTFSYLGAPFCSCRKLIVSCSARKSSANGKVKPSRRTKSNEELCRDLLEFMSAVGLPKQSVPSIKELCQHGRKDLAYLVRRRGYKLMQALLLSALNDCTEVGNSERPPSETMESANTEESLAKQDIEISLGNESSEGVDHGEEFVEGVSSSFETTLKGCHSKQNPSLHMNLNLHLPKREDPPINPSLHEKAANFIQSGVLDTFEGTLSVGNNHSMRPLDLGFSVSSLNDDEGWRCAERKVEIDHQNSGLQDESSLLDMEIKPKLNKGCITSSEVTVDNNPNRNLSLGDCKYVDYDKELAVEADENDNLVEIDHLKEMLHQKELELFQLKKQIEKEKLKLASLQTKGKAEIVDAERIIAAKDAELLAAEESLCGLKEVPIEYQGVGEIVEVAGSFNGWHDRVKLDRQLSPETVQPTASRKPFLWSTVLWLYPGIYEIKFIVDGHWISTIDIIASHFGCCALPRLSKMLLWPHICVDSDWMPARMLITDYKMLLMLTE